jgi:ABC-type transport system involved in Fe-S cluster assembly fused permease/ATPase subunit
MAELLTLPAAVTLSRLMAEFLAVLGWLLLAVVVLSLLVFGCAWVAENWRR